LDRLDILHLLDKLAVVGSDQDGSNKSSAIRPWLHGIDLDKVIWIGDTEVDVYAARDLGVKVCALTCGLRTRGYLASLSPDRLEVDLNSFAEIVLKVSVPVESINGQEVRAD
jgi:phosphoglycolate phosphatase-like HAD superfamily hydrolase